VVKSSYYFYYRKTVCPPQKKTRLNTENTFLGQRGRGFGWWVGGDRPVRKWCGIRGLVIGFHLFSYLTGLIPDVIGLSSICLILPAAQWPWGVLSLEQK
jgi:hypothetical protein